MPQATAVHSKKNQQWRVLKKNLRTQFHFKNLRPGQEEIIRAVLAGENTLAILPTGAGKSLCYQLPAIQLEGTTIVISPLISLMKDQKEKVVEVGIDAVELNSTLNASDLRENLSKISSHSTEILYVTPERFTHPNFIESLNHDKIDFVVVDEAHCVSQWGHDFRPAYLEIRETLKKLKNPPVLALTATATEPVAQDIQKQLGLKEMKIFRSSVYRENLFFEANYLESPKDKWDALLNKIQAHPNESGIVYTATVKAAKDIQTFLSEHQIECVIYHGKLKAKEREENQNLFMSGNAKLMIATNAFGMGIDKADIRFVIHFQFPASLEAYYQEAGRAGRDGKTSSCTLLYLKRDKSTQALFLSGRYPTALEVSKVYETLQSATEVEQSFQRILIQEKLGDLVSKKKNAVIFSLLKEMKVIKETKKDGMKLLLPNLSEGELHLLAETYEKQALADQEKLKHVTIYAQSALCRWKNILNYFGETEVTEHCGHCDNCNTVRSH